MTNREKLNNMSNEELAGVIRIQGGFCWHCIARKHCSRVAHYEFTTCQNEIEKWLESEAEE